MISAQRLVVLPFENRTGNSDFDALELVIADDLARDLGRSAEVVPLELAARAAHLATQDGDGGKLIELPTVADETRAGTAITGAFYRSGAELIFRAQIHDAALDQVISPLDPIRAPVEDPVAGLGGLERSLRTKLSENFDFPAPGERRYGPPAYSVYRVFVEGLERFWQGDFRLAVAKFEWVAGRAPSFVWASMMAAEAYLELGRPAEVAPLLDACERFRGSLPALDRLRLDWLRAESLGDYRAAVELAAEAARQAPASHWPFVLGVDSLRANQPRRAWSALVSLDPERGHGRGQSLYFEYLTSAHHLLNDHEAELLVAMRGRQLYPESLIVLAAEARALTALGRLPEVWGLLEKSASLGAEGTVTVGAVRTRVALEMAAHGHLGEAWEAGELALDWYRARPPGGARWSGRRGVGSLLLATGRAGRANPASADRGASGTSRPAPPCAPSWPTGWVDPSR